MAEKEQVSEAEIGQANPGGRTTRDQPDATAQRTADRFDALYSTITISPTYRRICREVYGDEYPEEAEQFGTATRTDLRRIADLLRVGPGQVFVDLGCGAGGPGLVVARSTGAALVGIDLSAVAIDQARARASAWRLDERATFLVDDLSASSLQSGGFDGAMSVDVLWVVPDKSAALLEVARVLRPATRFVFTTWEFAESPPDEPQVADYRPLLEAAGFAVEHYETDGMFESRFRALSAALSAARDELRADVGESMADALVQRYANRASLLPGWRRILVAARRASDASSRS
jgi:SAM-dependent methyltransferase